MISKTVLVGWELGGGLGHIRRLLPLARSLAASGHRIVFALKSKAEAAVITRALPSATIFEAPCGRRPMSSGPEPLAYNYADVLFQAGYASSDSLGALVRGWRQLFDAFKPAVILCDHSPTAVLAAADRLPVIHVGSGFATPPADKHFLVLHRDSLPGATEREAKVLDAIQQVQKRFNAPSLDRVSQLFCFAENFSCCLPELDPYRSVRSISAIGSAQELPQPHPQEKPGFLFGYLTAQDPRLPRLVESLVRAKITAGLYVRQASSALAKMATGSTVTFYDTPQKMPEALAKASAVLHHGGLSTTEMALTLGRPQFILPRHLEQGLTAEAVQKMGCGLNLLRMNADLGPLIQRAIRQGTYCKAADATAVQISHRAHENVSAKIVEACLKRLA